MWTTLGIAFIFMCLSDVWLPVLTDKASFGRTNTFKAGHKFYNEREYDDGFGDYTEAEKRVFSEMQRRKFMLQEADDEGLTPRESTEDWLRKEVRKEYTFPADTAETELDKEKNFPEYLTSEHDTRKEKIAGSLRKEESDLDDALNANRGTRKDELALEREEAKQGRQELKEEKNYDFLPKDGDLFEGDMVMDQRLRSIVMGQYSKRDAINDDSYLWPNGRVPYMLSEDILNDDGKLNSVRAAIEEFNHYTGIRYVEKLDSDINFVTFIVNDSLCYSSVGMQGGEQKISIGNGCERLGTVIHEMMHTIGFTHEQSRPDRDNYVTVFYRNIKPGLEHNFEKYTNSEVRRLEANEGFYDYDSCLHYNNKAFSVNGEDTIQSKFDSRRRFGQRDGFSRHDVYQINQLYPFILSQRDEALQDFQYN